MIAFEAIRNGFNNEEFFLEYLPTISLENNCCVGAEAIDSLAAAVRSSVADDFHSLNRKYAAFGSCDVLDHR